MLQRPRGGVVTQRSAKPFTPVQFRAWPPAKSFDFKSIYKTLVEQSQNENCEHSGNDEASPGTKTGTVNRVDPQSVSVSVLLPLDVPRLGFGARQMLELALAHAVSDKVEVAYRRGSMLAKRHELMHDVQAFCDG
jgi:hypothetical protein